LSSVALNIYKSTWWLSIHQVNIEINYTIISSSLAYSIVCSANWIAGILSSVSFFSCWKWKNESAANVHPRYLKTNKWTFSLNNYWKASLLTYAYTYVLPLNMGLGTVGVFLNNKNILFFILAWMDISSRLIFPLPTRKERNRWKYTSYSVSRTDNRIC
jgi:hypothetical protein